MLSRVNCVRVCSDGSGLGTAISETGRSANALEESTPAESGRRCGWNRSRTNLRQRQEILREHVVEEGARAALSDPLDDRRTLVAQLVEDRAGDEGGPVET